MVKKTSGKHRKSHKTARVSKDKHQPANEAKTGSGVVVSADAVQDDLVSWEASEYIHYEKGPSWYIGLLIIGLIGAWLTYVYIDTITAVVVALITLAVYFNSQKTPRVLRYTLSDQGLSVGEKHFDFLDFISFSIVEERGITSVSLLPIKRYLPPLSLYFAPEDQDQILNKLSQFIPFEQRSLSIADRIIERLKL